MPSHYGSSPMRKKNSPKKNSPKMKRSKPMSGMSDADYYKEHSKHHSAKHIRAMKELQRMGVERGKSHNFVKKYVGK
jgi:hypothetical protein